MIKFILCDSDKSMLVSNCQIVSKIMMNSNINYRIMPYTEYCNVMSESIKSEGPKIYILELDIPNKAGLDIIREIRENDFYSHIIISSNHYELSSKVFQSKLMVLDFISKYDAHDIKLEEAIELALKAFGKRKMIKVANQNVVTHIDIADIMYIMKEKSSNKCYIKTKNPEYEVNESLTHIEEQLTKSFIKTHRSCIVNKKYISEIDYKTQTITFKNGATITNMISKSHKKELQAI